MKYGDLPVSLGIHEVNCDEMMFYQYLPIKMKGVPTPVVEARLMCFHDIIGACCCDFIGVFGLDKYVGSHVYLTAKHLFQAPGHSFNRPGYHSDGFMTDDINYIWCDKNPTLFNGSDFKLTRDHELSMVEMEQQARHYMRYQYSENELLRLNQYNIHRVAEVTEPGMRTFFKLSFSDEQYNLIGNSHNYLLDYNWEMKPREISRNDPVKK